MSQIIPQLDQFQQENLSKAIEFLSEEEIYFVVWGLYDAKMAKIREKAYWDRVNSEVVVKKYEPEEFLKRVLDIGEKEIKGFRLSEGDEDVYHLLSLYFTNDPRFEAMSDEFSLKKGLFIYGNIGCGKTTAMNLFRRNQKSSFVINPCREIAQEFSKDGQQGIDQYFKNIKPSNPGMFFGQEEIGRCFDDLGVENVSVNFGNKSNVMAEVILDRYDRGQRLGDCSFTHITSNLDYDLLKEQYGDRVVSRMNEMFNIIAYPTTAKDKRG